MVHQIHPEFPSRPDITRELVQRGTNEVGSANSGMSGHNQTTNQREELPPYFPQSGNGPDEIGGAPHRISVTRGSRGPQRPMECDVRLAAFKNIGLELRRIADQKHLSKQVGHGLRRIADEINWSLVHGPQEQVEGFSRRRKNS